MRRRSAPSIREELALVGARPRRSLGQHFLRDPLAADRIVALTAPRAGETVVEIGPGLGVLSDRLAARAERLVLLELDAALAARATERYATQANVRVIHGDALTIAWSDLLASPGVIVGNLPYNVATAILHRLLEERVPTRRIVAMLQLEVAERLVAEPGTSSYGALSVLTQLECRPALCFTVAPGAFVPAPKVRSAVVTLDFPPASQLAIGNRARFRRVVRSAFQKRRKQLGNALQGVVSEPRELLTRIGIDATRRPETLSLEEFALLERESEDA